MKKVTRIFESNVLLEEYRELLKDESIEALPLLISGNSMAPFLIHQRDTVFLSRLVRPVKVGDVLLYQRDNGSYILHRVYRVENDTCTMIGDGQFVLEKGIRADQIIAVMTSAMRKGKKQAPGCFWWEFFERVWIHMIPLRRIVWKTYNMFTGGRP